MKMVKKTKVDYDYENDILYLYTGEKVKDSLEVENFVIDFSSTNSIVSVEVMDASEFLSEMLDISVTKKLLASLKEAGIKIHQGREMLYVVLILPLVVNKQKMDVRVPVPTAKVAVEV